jgi:hypothetical protein
VVAVGAFLVGCWDNPQTSEDGISIIIRLIGEDTTTVSDSVDVALNTLSSTDLSGETAVKMADLIPDDFIGTYVDKDDESWDMRELYGYRLIGSDGFSPHQKTDKETGRAGDDLTWELMKHGFIKKTSRDAAYDSEVSLSGMYRVKEVDAIEVYRKIDVKIDTGSTVTTIQIRLAELEKSDFNGSPSVKLSDILSLVDEPESMDFTVEALDGFTGMSPFTWEQMQSGYWIYDTDKLGFDPDLGGKSKIGVVKEIMVSM